MLRKLAVWILGAGFSVACALALIGGAWLWWSVHRTIDPGTERLHVAQGQSLGNIAEALQHRGAIDETLSLRVWGRITGLGRRIKAGTYTFEGELTLIQLLERLVAGDVLSHQIVFPEGWRFRQWRAAMRNAPGLTSTIDDIGVDVLMQRIGATGVHPEGRFFPDTYSYPDGSTDVQLLQRAYQRMQSVLDTAWTSRIAELPLKDEDEALILASIIEKETGAAHERPLIAGVFVNRLRKNMRLQTDPTVIYGLGEAFDGNITRTHLNTDGPYNTYTRSGLTPTPIAMPGKDAIMAAVNPEQTNALYFVSRGDGTHKFSRTLEEHNAAVRKYQLKQGGN